MSIYNVIDLIEHIIYPNKCPFCGAGIEFNKHCCEKCQEKVDLQKGTFIQYKYPKNINTLVVPFEYSVDFQKSVFDLKFNDRHKPAQHMAYYLCKMIIDCKLYSQVDVIIPVPLHKKKLKQRGYNQSEVLAKYLSRILNKKIEKNVLIKIKHTKEQHTLNRHQREKNLQGAFTCKNAHKIKGKKVLLLDDVYTTGNTINECAKMLKQFGADSIICACICKSNKIK